MLAYKDEALYNSLKEIGTLDEKLLSEAFEEAKSKDGSLAEVLVRKDVLSDDNVGKIISDLSGFPLARLAEISIPLEILKIVPESVAKKQRAVVFDKSDMELKLAMLDPTDNEFVNLVGQKAGVPVKVYITTTLDMDKALVLYKRDLQKKFESMFTDPGKAVDLMIEYAYATRVSDIHIEPQLRDQSVVRFRIDGILHEVLRFSPDLHEQIVGRIKVLAKLRTDEHASAQDGKMQIPIEGEVLDIRVSIVPMIEGEKVVMRLLSSALQQFFLETLGMDENQLERVRRAVDKSFGMIISAGPTGSGKTTTIYSLLKILNSRETNIATIEDPVEYDIVGVNQIQVNPQTNLTFADGLKSILRQDPNIIYVGEIRDDETAGIAVNAALTGHLVLTTLHTNDAAGALPRLIDMGVEPFLAASTVDVVICQRLIRKICPKCKSSVVVKLDKYSQLIPGLVLKKVFEDKKELRTYVGKGCDVCRNTGYLGRIGVFEVLEMSEVLRKLIIDRSDAATISAQAVKEGMQTMMEDGLLKVARGESTIEEVLRVLQE